MRGELAGHADDAHRVGPVGRDGEVEDHVVETEHLAHVAAELGGGVETEDAAVVVAEAELLGRAEHAVAHLAADLAAFEREAARAAWRPTARTGTTMPATTLGAPHTTRVTPSPVVMSTSDSLSAFGCGHDLEHLRGDDAGDLLAGLLDALDLEAELVERGDHVGDRRGRPG